MSEEILVSEKLTKRYSKHVALDNVSISVRRNRIFGLLGPNGAGKTSLIRIINQITGPDEGAVFFNGETLSSKHIGKIGYLPEERGLYKKMKVGEQALYLAQLKGLTRKDAIDKLKYWFEKFEIETWWNKNVEDLSKGMQQKVQFITTVLHEPELLIFDEPFSGFDPINKEQIKKEILFLRDKGASIIFSTHNMESVEELCDDIALINNSKKILSGSVSDIQKAHKTNTFNIGFDGSAESFVNSLKDKVIIVELKEEKELIATVKLNENISLNNILSLLIPVVSITSCNEVIPSMRDVFIDSVTKSETT